MTSCAEINTDCYKVHQTGKYKNKLHCVDHDLYSGTIDLQMQAYVIVDCEQSWEREKEREIDYKKI